MARVNMIFGMTSQEPVHDSCGLINGYIENGLRTIGHQVTTFYRRTPDNNFDNLNDRFVPLAAAQRLHQIRNCPADIHFFDVSGLGCGGWDLAPSAKKILFLHSIEQNQGLALARENFNLYITNSAYMTGVVHGLLTYPNWHQRSVYLASSWNRITNIRLPFPMLDHAEGRTVGADLSTGIRKAMDDNVVLGHAIQRDKADPSAVLSTVYYLNQLAKMYSFSHRIVLVVSPLLKKRLVNLAESVALEDEFDLDSHFLETPTLSQNALVELMKSSHFALCYNTYPDTFGLYLLESVFHGCPVYTNGIGNYRYLLPKNHGINVFNPTNGEAAETSKYLSLARVILNDILENRAEQDCSRGKAYISEQCNQKVFEKDLSKVFDKLHQNPNPEPIEFDSLVMTWNPLVQYYDEQTGFVQSDYQSFHLDETQRALLGEALNSPCSRFQTRDQTRGLQNLFRQGILAFQREVKHGSC